MRHDRPQRGCTDVPCLAVFLLVAVGSLAFAAAALSMGETAELTRGRDYEGRPCGGGAPPAAGNITDWPHRTYLWQPIGPDIPQGYAVCVAQCPRYAPGANASREANYGMLHRHIPLLDVTYDTRPVWHRCQPVEPYSFDAAVVSPTALSGVDFGVDVLMGAASDMSEAAAAIGVAQAVAFAAAMGVSAALAWGGVPAARCLMPCGCALSVLCTALLGATCISFALSVDGTYLQGDAALWLCVGVALLLGTVLACVVGCLVWDYAPTAVAVLEEARQVVAGVPAMLLIPVVTTAAMAGAVTLAGVSIAALVSDVTPATLVVPDRFADHGNATLELTTAPTASALQPLASLIVVGTLWVVLFLQSFTYMAASVCAAEWLRAGEPEADEPRIASGCSTVLHAICAASKHAGSIAFASVAITVLRLPRLLFRLREETMRVGREDGVSVPCGPCCLQALDRLLHRMSDSALAAQALLGAEELHEETDLQDNAEGCSQAACGFFAASRQLRLIYLHRMPMISIHMFKANAFTSLLQAGLAACSAAVAWQLLRVDALSQTETASASGVMVILLPFAVVSNVMAVHHACIDTLLLGYAWDVQHAGSVHITQAMKALCKEGVLPRVGERPMKLVEMKSCTSFTISGAVKPPKREQCADGLGVKEADDDAPVSLVGDMQSQQDIACPATPQDSFHITGMNG